MDGSWDPSRDITPGHRLDPCDKLSPAGVLQGPKLPALHSAMDAGRGPVLFELLCIVLTQSPSGAHRDAASNCLHFDVRSALLHLPPHLF